MTSLISTIPCLSSPAVYPSWAISVHSSTIFSYSPTISAQSPATCANVMAATRDFVALSNIVCMAWCDNKFVLPASPIAENLQRCNRALYTICKGIAAPIMMNGSWTLVCHDLAKRLSHYLYFFSFLFLFLWTYNYKVECGKVSRDFVTMSQLVWRMVTSQSQSQGVTWLE